MSESKPIPQQMKALIVTVDGDYSAGRGFEWKEVPAPTLDESKDPEDAEFVLVKTLYAGLCGSDRGIWFRNAFGDLISNSLAKEGKNWRIPGHELLGRVVAMGSKAKATLSFDEGTMVSAESHPFCGTCYQCRIGAHHVCANAEIMGFSQDGCFAEYVKLPAKVLWPTNTEKIRPEVAAIQEPFGNAVHACSVTELSGQNVLISGCGSIGLFCILVARHLGAKQVIGLDIDETRLNLAKRLGAHVTIPLILEKKKGLFAADAKLMAQIKELTEGVGVDVAMEMAGFNVSLNNCIQATRRGGEVVLFGIKSGDFVIQDYSSLILDGKNIHSVIGRRIFGTWERTRALLEAPAPGKENQVQKKIYEVILENGKGTIFPIREFDPKRFEAAMDQHNKLVFQFDSI